MTRPNDEDSRLKESHAIQPSKSSVTLVKATTDTQVEVCEHRSQDKANECSSVRTIEVHFAQVVEVLSSDAGNPIDRRSQTS
jgi:hypothetical protein